MENKEINLSEITNRIVFEINPEMIILFGSRARGENKPDSDLDILIVESKPFNKLRSRWKETIKIRRLLDDTNIAKDILVYSKDEMEYWKDSINHIIPRSLKEGKVLYARH